MGTIEAKGQNGRVVFDGAAVTIIRKGFVARSLIGKGEKRIPISSITAVQWKPAKLGFRGFIQFTVPGGNERRSRAGRQIEDAMKDENSVVFLSRRMPEFEVLRDAVQQAIERGNTSSVPVLDVPDQLRRLGELHTAGVVTDEEFVAAKADLLNRL